MLSAPGLSTALNSRFKEALCLSPFPNWYLNFPRLISYGSNPNTGSRLQTGQIGRVHFEALGVG